MSGTYKAKGGETFNLVARQTTGNDLDAAKIRRANPGIAEPILEGTILQIPFETDVITDAPLADLKITVDGTQIGTFDDFEIAFAIDAIAKAGFTVPNEPETRVLFPPLASPRVSISAGKTLLTGRVESPRTANTPTTKDLTISCYSLPGVLERAHPPMAAFPLEFTNANLLQISKDLCLYHGVNCTFETESGPLFKRVDIKPGGPVLAFLADLAKQRGPVITSNAGGDLIFWEGVAAGSPVSTLEKGKHPVENVELTIDESKYYSSVTGSTPAKTKRKPGKKFTVDNPHATDLVRPFDFEAKDIDDGELETAVNAMAGRMFAGVVQVSVELSTWLNDEGDIYTPNTTVMLKSPEDFIPDFYEFLIAGVTLKASAGVKTASLSLVLPGVYSGEIPGVLPWQ